MLFRLAIPPLAKSRAVNNVRLPVEEEILFVHPSTIGSSLHRHYLHEAVHLLLPRDKYPSFIGNPSIFTENPGAVELSLSVLTSKKSVRKMTSYSLTLTTVVTIGF